VLSAAERWIAYDSELVLIDALYPTHEVVAGFAGKPEGILRKLALLALFPTNRVPLVPTVIVRKRRPLHNRQWIFL
jgi:hypothetical protein